MPDQMEPTDKDRDIASIWEIIHKTRTILLDITEGMKDCSEKTRILREVDFLEKAQTKAGKHLTEVGIGVDRFSGADRVVMPGAASFARVSSGSKASDS